MLLKGYTLTVEFVFVASDISHVSQRNKSKELLARTTMQNKARHEYIVNSPVPQELPINTQHKQVEDTGKPENDKNAKKIQKERRNSKKGKRRVSIISNQGYASDDTMKDFSWASHQFDGIHGRNDALENIVVLSSAYEHGPLEER